MDIAKKRTDDSYLFWCFRIMCYFYRLFGLSYITNLRCGSVESATISFRRFWYILVIFLIFFFTILIFSSHVIVTFPLDDHWKTSIFMIGYAVYVVYVMLIIGVVTFFKAHVLLKNIRELISLEKQIGLCLKSGVVLKGVTIMCIVIQLANMIEKNLWPLPIFPLKEREDANIVNASLVNGTKSVSVNPWEMFMGIGYIVSSPASIYLELQLIFVSVFFALCLHTLWNRVDRLNEDGHYERVHELKSLQKMYLQIANCVDGANHGMSGGILFKYSSSFIFACFAGVLSVIHDETRWKMWGLKQFLINLCQIIFPTTAVGYMTNQAKNLDMLLQKLLQKSPLSPEMENQILAFRLMIRSSRIEFTGGDLFVVKPSLIIGVLSSILTYAVILIQFPR